MQLIPTCSGARLTLEKAAFGSYFLRMPIRQASRRDHASADLFEAPASPTPAGFRYAPDLFSPEVEKAFVAQFETLPFKPFEFHGYLGNRRVVSFGYRYDYAGRALRSAEEMPAFLAPLRRIASRFAGIPESDWPRRS